MIVKSADLGHAAVDWLQHNEWSARVTEEFYQQVGGAGINVHYQKGAQTRADVVEVEQLACCFCMGEKFQISP